MLKVYDRQRRLTGILQNAFSVKEEQRINSISMFYFSLPYSDSKNGLCKPLHYVRWGDGDLYRIMPETATVDETGAVEYTCEHVLALLIDCVMFGQHVIGNIGVHTPAVISWLLGNQNRSYDPWAGAWVVDPQKQVNWVLGECDFARQFEYGWEQETILSALFSVPKPFSEKYMWTYDTSVYPYVLNLKRIDEGINPQMYIRARKNLLALVRAGDPTTVCTRLYPLGEGEGINQLNIRGVNGGVPYLQSPQQHIDEYGIVERAWIDRRYTDAQSLKDAAQATLNALQEPYEEYEVDFAVLGADQFDQPGLGKVVEVVGFKKTYITGIDWDHDEVALSKLHIANQPRNIAGSIAEMQDRQRIEMSYAQGATQFFAQNWYDNADAENPLLMKVYIPDGLKIINYVQLDVEVTGFRKPFKITQGGGGQTIEQSNTTSSGASSAVTTQSGGGHTSGASSALTTRDGGGQTSGGSSLLTTRDGGKDTRTAQSGGSGTTAQNTVTTVPQATQRVDITTVVANIPTHYFLRTSQDGDPAHRHEVESHYHRTSTTPHTHDFPHTHTVGSHSHQVELEDHSHGMVHTHQINSHYHEMAHTHQIESHTHNMSHTHGIQHTHRIEDHTHRLEPGIEHSGSPQRFSIRINGVVRHTQVGRSWQGRIEQWLVNADKVIPRNTYHRIEIIPDVAAYCMQTVNFQGFMQSRGDTTV